MRSPALNRSRSTRAAAPVRRRTVTFTPDDIEFVGPDRERAQAFGWANVKPSTHMPVFDLDRRKA